MTDLFNKEDVLTIATADQAVIGTKGYFGYSLRDLINAVKLNKVKTLSDVNRDDEPYCFLNEHELSFLFFLPLDKVKKPTYRALQNIDELFDFFYPPKDDVYSQTEKAKILLGKKITLKNKINDRIKVMVTQDIEFSSDISDSSNTYLNCLELKYLFDNYEILIDGEFVPFGVQE